MLQRTLGFWVPLFVNGFGVLPRRRTCAVTTVVGAPLVVECKGASYTKEDVEQLQQRYITALEQLYERHRAALGGASAAARISIVD